MMRVPFLAAAMLMMAASTAGAVNFSQADRNRDGVVVYVEARRVFPGLTEIHFEKCDPDGNGRITKQQFPLLNNFYTMVYLNRN